MAEHNQQFSSFEEWVNKASSWLTRHPEYNNTEHGETKGYRGRHFTAMCFDAKGRRCRCGADLMRARDEGAFPVRWIWPDQIWELSLQNTEMLAALKAAEQFILNGIEMGTIRMPPNGSPDTALETLPAIQAAIAKAEGRPNG